MTFDLSFSKVMEETAAAGVGVKGQRSGVDVCGQLEVLEGVEGDVTTVHHSEDHRDVAALEGQQLDGSQVGNGAVETGSGAEVKVEVKLEFSHLYFGSWDIFNENGSKSVENTIGSMCDGGFSKVETFNKGTLTIWMCWWVCEIVTRL